MTSRHGTSISRTLRRALDAGALVVPLLALGGCSEREPLPLSELVRSGDAYLHPETLEPYSGAAFAAFTAAPRQVERRIRLRDGHYDGAFELYYGNRRLSVREIYREGRKDGPYEWYLENGELYERGTYKNGLRDGPYEAFFGGGRIYETGTYRHGEFDGPREWYLDGRLIERVTYVRGQIDGPYERYEPNGALKRKGTLRYGSPCGSWIEGAERVVYPTCGYVSD